MDSEKKRPSIEIELDERQASGTYSNLVMIAHSHTEFVLDFLTVMPGVPKARVVKRMVVNPIQAKKLAIALRENVQNYEQNFGEIEVREKVDVPMNFRGPMPEA